MFRTNVPVTAGGFFDRQEELSRLQEHIARLRTGEPAWVAIPGSRKIGKTSLLLELARQSEDPAVVFAVLDSFEEHPPSPAIFRRYVLRVLDGAFASELGLSLEALAHRPREFRSALQQSARFQKLSPALRASILELPERPVEGDLIREALRMPERLAEALGLYFVVAWDEFQQLAELSSARGAGDPLPLMRSIWQRHRRVAYIISGSAKTVLTKLVTGETSPFFQHFSLMELGPFSEEEGERLLTESAPEDLPIPPTLARRAVEVLGGHPFYLQLFGEAPTARQAPYDESSLKEALQEVPFSNTGRLALYFDSVFHGLVGRSTYLAAVLEALAGGPTRLTDVARAIGAPTGSAVRYLERLGDAVGRQDDGRYTLTDPTFGLWLRWRRPGGTVVPMRLVGDEAEQRAADHLARMGFDLVYQSRASRGAFDLLATRGHRQLGVQVKRSSLPLRFIREEWRRMNAGAQRLGWRWVVAAVVPDPETAIILLDPAHAKRGKEVRLDEKAAIDNLLLWLDRQSGS